MGYGYNKCYLLDKITQNKWKEHYTSADLPTLSQVLEFLKERQDILQSQEEPHSFKQNYNNSFSYNQCNAISGSNQFVFKSN